MIKMSEWRPGLGKRNKCPRATTITSDQVAGLLHVLLIKKIPGVGRPPAMRQNMRESEDQEKLPPLVTV